MLIGVVVMVLLQNFVSYDRPNLISEQGRSPEV